MKKRKVENADPEASSARTQEDDPLSLSHMLERPESALNDPVWILMKQILAGTVLAWFLSLLGASRIALGVWVIAIAAGGSWILSVRMLFLDAKAKKFWTAWLGLSALFVVLFNYAAKVWTVAVFMAVIFLLIRRYKPYRHLISKRRAQLSAAAALAFLLLTVFWRFSYPPAAAEASIGFFPGLGLNIASYAIWCLRFFFIFTLANLFVAVRFHFMKIKRKLAVSALMLIIVPVVLLFIMGIVILYGVLGESRAVRAGVVLQDWAALADSNERLIFDLSGEVFVDNRSGEEKDMSSLPSWWDEFLQTLDSDPDGRDIFFKEGRTGIYFWHASELWLMCMTDDPSEKIEFRGAKVNTQMMNRLAGIVRADVIISASNPISLSSLRGGSPETISIESDRQNEIVGSYLPEGSDPEKEGSSKTGISLWDKRLYFGMTHIDIIAVGREGFQNLSLLLMLKTSPSEILDEIFSAKNPLGVAFLIGISSVAGMMLVMEFFALILGLRIVTGITSAVRALSKGTRRIADGDFDTKIDIPNEDELGDLAVAFNEMAAAVKRGREEALIRDKLERELRVAREIQEKLLPHDMPTLQGFEISGTSLPSQQVSGDYFDFLDMESGQLGIAVADVSGKGIPAALLMANLQASLHGQSVESGNVSLVVGKINDLLARSTDAHMFATFFYGILDRIHSTFTYTNAGHNPPFLFHADGSFDRLEPGGMIIGFLACQKYTQKTLSILPGDTLVLFTDGITEAVRPIVSSLEEKYFGEERLQAVIERNLKRSAAEIQGAILNAVSRHTGGANAIDDITLVVIKRRAEDERPSSEGPIGEPD